MAEEEKVLEPQPQTPETQETSGERSNVPLDAFLELLGLKHKKIELKFTNDTEIDKIVRFLNASDALAFAPGTVIYGNDAKRNQNYVFMADFLQTKFLLDTMDKTGEIPDAHVHELSFKGSEIVANAMATAHKDNMLIFDECGNARDRINFLYSLYAGNNTATGDKTPEFILSEQIFKRFMLYKLESIENQADPEKQNQMIVDFMQQFAFRDTILRDKNNEFFDVLGKVKKNHDNAAYMKVLLKDGTYMNLFDLDPTKHYTIMHSVDASKLKTPFDFSNIDINGDFVCKNNKKAAIVFPNKINGLFDCSGYSFDIKRIPGGATKVNLEYSVKNFADLNNIRFPKSVRHLIVKTSIITNVLNLAQKENSGNDPELVAYREFTKKHRKIQITNSGDNPLVLQDELKKLQQETKEKTPNPEPVLAKQPEIPVYTEDTKDWILRKRLVVLLEAEFANVKDLESIVKQVLSKNNAIIRQQKMQFDGNIVACVHTGDINKVKELVLQFINTPTAVKAQATKPVVTKAPVVEADQKKSKKIKGIKFKKYIPASVYKQIEKACGKNTMLLHSVLERISKINYDYTKLAHDVSLIHIRKSGEFESIQYTSKHNGASAVMGMEANDNRRIVLTINPQDKIIMATAFFADHVNNSKNDKQYNDVAIPNAAKGYLMDGKTPVTRDLVNTGDYIDVDIKLKELKEKIVQTVVVTQQKTITTVIETTTTEVTVAPKQKRKRIMTPVATTSNGNVQCSLLDVMALEEETYAIVKMLEAKIQEMKAKQAPRSMMEKLQNKLMEICRS